MKILSAQYLVTMAEGKTDVIIDGAIAIEGDEIIDVGTEHDLLQRYPNSLHEDYPDHVIIPGLINAHTHLDMSMYRESTPADEQLGSGVNFVDWLIGCLEYKRRVDHSQQRQAVEWGLDECLRSGTTCVADMGNYEGIFSLLEEKRVRAVVFPEVISYDSAISKDLFESALAIVEKYQEADSDLVSVGMGPYSPFILSRNILRILGQYSRSSNLPLMIHAANSFAEMEFFNDSTGDIARKLFPNIGWDELPPAHHRTPIEHLSQIGLLECKPMLIGCIQTTESDLDHIARSGSKIVLTLRAGSLLKQGQPDYAKISERHIVTALGTDGMSSVKTLSMWDEMRTFIDTYRDKLPLTGRSVLELATINGAKAVGLEEEIGSLEIGKKADFAVIKTTGLNLDGDFLMRLIEQIENGRIEAVFVGGEIAKSLN